MIGSSSRPDEDWDVVLVGGGVMRATLGVLLSEVQARRVLGLMPLGTTGHPTGVAP